jgi:hypothetical protein
MFGRFSRRYFVKLAAFSALGMAATPANGEPKSPPDRHAPVSFPDSFVWARPHQLTRSKALSMKTAAAGRTTLPTCVMAQREFYLGSLSARMSSL